jgi:beta-glucosidase
MLKFPEGFLWGTSTSSYQIEGAVNAGGRGESIWDVFARTPGKVHGGDTGEIACDHYHHWKEDVALMKALGYNAYRFSLAWPRFFPQGRGALNPEGVSFYSRLVDELLEAGITPMVTLYHWDLPTALPGGWTQRDTAYAFADYTKAAVGALGDRVKLWTTLNEPWCSSLLSYYLGEHAPGERDLAAALKAAHHLLLAHGLAVPEIRAAVKQAEVGIVLNLMPVRPYTRSRADLNAMRQFDGSFNRWFLDPIFGRRYPADMLKEYTQMGALDSETPDDMREEDFELISAPIDNLGINYYEGLRVKAQPGHEMQPQRFLLEKDPEHAKTDMGWDVNPQGLYDILVRVSAEYQPAKIYVTENGAAYHDAPNGEGAVHDTRRIAYLGSHLDAFGRAIQAGVPGAGYFAWSFMDNFEWAYGYSQRFGLVYVDYPTQRRIPKDSAYFYGEIARKNELE